MPEWHGESRVIRLDNAAGPNGISYPLPGVERFKVAALTFQLVTTAAVANRQVVARLVDGTGATVYGVAAPAVQTATQTVTYSFAPDVATFGTAALGFMGGPFPSSELPENLSVVVTVAGANAADVIADGRLLVRQWSRLDAEA